MWLDKKVGFGVQSLPCGGNCCRNLYLGERQSEKSPVYRLMISSMVRDVILEMAFISILSDFMTLAIAAALAISSSARPSTKAVVI